MEPTITLKEHYDALERERERRYAALDTERERRYAERADAAKEAVAAALVAQKELLAAALASSKEAVIKQETTSSQLLNALTEKIDTLGKDLGGRIESLAKTRDEGEGSGRRGQANYTNLIAGVGLFLTLLTIGSIVLTLMR